MSQIPAVAPRKHNGRKQNNKNSDCCSQPGPGPVSPFKYNCNKNLQSRAEREPLFSSQSTRLEPDPVSSSLVEDNMFLQFDSVRVHFLMTYSSFFFPSLSLLNL